MRQPNPYRPGFNQSPDVLAGRDDLLGAARETLDVAALDGRTPRPMILVGSRGVGKTVVLGEIAAIAAERHGWPTVHIEIRPGVSFIDQLCTRLDAVRELLLETPRGKHFEVQAVSAKLAAFGIGGEVGVVRRDPSDDSDDLRVERALSAACEAAIDRGAGLALSIDELQLAQRGQLADLTATLQQHVPDNWPLMVVAAGLTNVRNPERSVTYLERGEWHEIGLLDHDDTLRALVGPSEHAGRPLSREAATLLANATGGYPYAIQVFGHHAWRRSADAARITVTHARAALIDAERDLASGLYAARWEDASPREQQYLAAVAQLTVAGHEPTGVQVASELGATSRELSYLRDRLIKKGTLVPVGRSLTFPVPGMAEWIANR